MVTAYNPCKSTKGLNTVYKQHLRYLRSENDDRDPLKAFEEDLRDTLAAWIEDGEHVMLSMDANQDVRSGSLHRMLATLGLRDIILARHQSQGPPPTPTNAMSQKFLLTASSQP